MAESGQERTEEATPKRRRDAHKKGQVSRSAEVPGAAALLAGVVALRTVGPTSWTALQHVLQFGLSSAQRTDIAPVDIINIIGQECTQGFLALLPIMLTLVLAAAAAGLSQTGLVVSAGLLVPKFSRVNPMEGFKRIFSMKTGFELLKQLARLILLGAVAFAVVQPTLLQIMQLGYGSIQNAPGILGNAVLDLIFRMAMVSGILAAVDYSFQRNRFLKQLRMTKQEVREEIKQNEGDPAVKNRIRRLQRALARKRMMEKVPTAAVVIANPTHFAVALRYESGKTRAPIVVAKGQDFMALQIKEIARKHNIPIVENPPLARTIFAAVKVDQEIPAQFYRAVAEVLAFVYRLKRRW